MEGEDEPYPRLAKRVKLEKGKDALPLASGSGSPTREQTRSPLTSLGRAVTPPPPRLKSDAGRTPRNDATRQGKAGTKVLPSPFSLNRVADLPDMCNVDAVGLRDILGDPLIRECWQFNYLFDIDYVMKALDEDVRNMVSVKIVHGSWKKEDGHRVMLEESAKRYSNVQLITAHMPEAFGTHHSKMMILLRHDDTAQIVIHTANMISQDWEGMCQAVWRSPPLPFQKNTDKQPESAIGTGHRFKTDLLGYLRAYGGRLKSLVEQLSKYDFSSVRAALVASVPTRQPMDPRKSDKGTSFGWVRLKEVLGCIPVRPGPAAEPSPASLVTQISSIASLGPTDKWFKSFTDVLSATRDPPKCLKALTTASFKKPRGSSTSPTHEIIFPTPDEIRRSLAGYVSGASIHMRLQSAAQQKQLAYMRPHLRYWAGDGAVANAVRASAAGVQGRALRRRIAPHIKTYVRFADQRKEHIDWAMVTSANLSTQAWGNFPAKEGTDVRICSYEIGVVVWPDLCRGEGGGREEDVSMVPVFAKDLPEAIDLEGGESECEGSTGGKGDKVIVGIRMPYDLPLVPYSEDEVPWCATATHEEPDWMGRVWKNDAS
ncbi:tyrosyl-DNA phosphodiesterase I [Lineolata rhizophorae]|uniref:Tyrosyl-DNA phosphodiesterase I n=1 Tax=Lineolata rhizophorae TaxID=578093 RepID=A0A6A6NUH7_9PEZI|nr:tyrosyl-DNA phosphodiesterase I [Lineolata rhizophorae]